MIFPRAAIIRVFLLLALAAPGAWGEGGCTGSCGGDVYRMPLEDLAVDTFNELAERAKDGPLRIGKGVTAKEVALADVRMLESALLGAIRRNDIKIAYSDNDRECPLKDNGGSCVTFLTETESMQLSVDIGRILRHQADPRFIQRALIHEAYRLSRQEDVNDQYSRRLAELVQGTIDPDVAKALSQLGDTHQRAAGKQPPGREAEDCDPGAPGRAAEPLARNLRAIEVVVKAAKAKQAGKEAAGSLEAFHQCAERNRAIPWVCEKNYRGDKSRLPTAKIPAAERAAREKVLFCRVFNGLASECNKVPSSP